MFDLRWLIGGLFTVYGVLLTVVGLFDSQAAVTKAQGVRINVWVGLGMLAFGLFFLLWRWLRPDRDRQQPGRQEPDAQQPAPRQWTTDDDESLPVESLQQQSER